MEELVQKLGGVYHELHVIDFARVEDIKQSAPNEQQRAALLQELGENPTPARRYAIEYRKGLYKSYKPGIDDETLDHLVGASLRHSTVLEVGGGPAYIAERAATGFCCDLTLHPRLHDAGVVGIQGDFCHEATFHECMDRLHAAKGPVLVILSYCLDRMADQRKAMRHFARAVKETKGKGLITVCLPAVPMSAGVQMVNYRQGEWITQGNDALADYHAIVRAADSEGLCFIAGGLTTHFNVCLDGYESLPCYVMVFDSDL